MDIEAEAYGPSTSLSSATRLAMMARRAYWMNRSRVQDRGMCIHRSLNEIAFRDVSSALLGAKDTTMWGPGADRPGFGAGTAARFSSGTLSGPLASSWQAIRR